MCVREDTRPIERRKTECQTTRWFLWLIFFPPFWTSTSSYSLTCFQLLKQSASEPPPFTHLLNVLLPQPRFACSACCLLLTLAPLGMRNVSGLPLWHENDFEKQLIRCKTLDDRSVNIYTSAHICKHERKVCTREKWFYPLAGITQRTQCVGHVLKSSACALSYVSIWRHLLLPHVH